MSKIVAKSQLKGKKRNRAATKAPTALLDIKFLILDELKKHKNQELNRSILKKALKIDDTDLPLFQDAIRELKVEEQVRIEGAAGQGGKVCLNRSQIVATEEGIVEEITSEADLYRPIVKCLKLTLIPELGINRNLYSIEITASSKGGRLGKYSCPDISLVGVKTYKVLQSLGPIVFTFEVKKSLEQAQITAVMQTKDHKRFAHYSYLVVQVRRTLNLKEKTRVTDLVERCRNEGVGFRKCQCTESRSARQFSRRTFFGHFKDRYHAFYSGMFKRQR
jgi:hypothetical protein